MLPILIKHLAENCGFHGTLLILGGCMLHVCVSATLYRPLSAHVEQTQSQESSGANKPLDENINPSTAGMLTTSTYLDTCEVVGSELNDKFIEHLFLEECKNHLNYYASKQAGNWTTTREKSLFLSGKSMLNPSLFQPTTNPRRRATMR